MKNVFKYIKEAIKLSAQNLVKNLGWPFGAVIVKDSKIIWKWKNQVTSRNDPTAHAEIQAIRNACKKLKTFDLSGCEIYTSCEPCPMCLWAIYRSHIDKVYFANTQKDAADIGFDDKFIYQEIGKVPSKRKIKFQEVDHQEAIKVFQKRNNKKNKKMY